MGGNPSEALTGAQRALVEVFASYKHSVTDFEGRMWQGLIDEFGDEAIVRFLEAHVRRSAFAPKVSDALALLQPGANNAVAALEELSQAVSRCGPYEPPIFSDAALPEAVQRLGGWVAVNEQLPSPEDRFGYEAFFKRFQAAYQIACAQQALRQGAEPLLRGLHDLSRERKALGYAPRAGDVAGTPAGLLELEGGSGTVDHERTRG